MELINGMMVITSEILFFSALLSNNFGGVLLTEL